MPSTPTTRGRLEKQGSGENSNSWGARLNSNTTNWLLAAHPDAYLYGTLLQAEGYLVNDERLPVWKLALEEALREIDSAGKRKQNGAAPLAPRGMFNIRRGIA